MAIYANLMGRLGNQMFIYAFARALQEKNNNSKIKLSCSEENRLINYHAFDCAECSGNEERKGKTLLQQALSVIYCKSAMGKSPAELFSLEKKYRALFSRHNLYFCRNGYLPFERGKEQNTFLVGFFQSARYFADIRDILLREFVPKDISGISTETIQALRDNPKSVCVSIRLGDYLKHPLHGVCTVDYYVRAMRLMQEKLGDPLFYVSTESPDVIKNMEEFKSFRMVFEDSHLQDFEKMYLTNQCTNFILSNSTFSWWGYYLSTNREKNNGITIAPNRWFNGDTPCDIYMEDWTLIEP